MTMTILDPDQEHLVPKLPNPDAISPIVKLILPRNAYMEAQVKRAKQESIFTKFCHSVAHNAVAWVLCTRISVNEITYRVYAYWGTNLTIAMSEDTLLVYEMTALISNDAPFDTCAHHIRYITIEGDSVTILVNGTSIKIPR